MGRSLFALEAHSNLRAESARLSAAWKNFAIKKRDDPDVRPVVLNSWNRCASSELDPLTGLSPRVLTDTDIREYVEHDPLFAEIKLALSPLYRAALESDHMLVCCDALGHIMHLAGDSAIRRRAEKMNFVVGSHWGETQAGTNAIGTTIATGQPFQLFGPEHYCQGVHEWTCSASPIRDPATNNVLAVIDMTALREEFHPHTLVSVMTVTQLIEERLRSKYAAERYRLLELYANRATSHFPIAVLDRTGHVVKAAAAFHEHNWIDTDNRLRDCPSFDVTVACSWTAEGASGAWSFMREPCLGSHYPVGAIVSIVKSGAALLRRQSSAPSSEPDDLDAFSHLIGRDDAFLRAIGIACTAAHGALPVLIEGETGTGKELFAQAIHARSGRKDKPFLAVNCGALAKDLAVSEFFGYDGGSFTGAAREGRIGKFEQANGGTLLLDEISDMPLDLQVLLLRVLDEKKLVRVGGRRSISLDVRIVAATNQDLLELVGKGHFRRDLYYRLGVIKIRLPALRERRRDIGLLFEHYCKRAFAEAGRPAPLIERDVMTTLEHYSWPGNIRELRNVAERLSISAQGDAIRTQDLPVDVSALPVCEERVQNRAGLPLKEQEVQAIRSMLIESGNVSEAARRLGINRSTIYRKLRKLPGPS